MHVNPFLHNLFKNTIHKARISLLTTLIEGIIKVKKLNLTALGRALEGDIQERSSIFKVDRFFRNSFFLTEKTQHMIYKNIIYSLISAKKRPKIIVDWSKFPNVDYYILRASLVAPGRALTLYEEVHPKKKENNTKIHNQFLDTLKTLLPEACIPVIITDAGFKNPWFKKVVKLGWDYVGRVRGLVKYDDGKGFSPSKELHRAAKEKREEFLGEKKLSKKGTLLTNFYRYKHTLLGRKKYTKNNKVSTNKDSINYGKSYREPWIIVSSLKNDCRAIRIYKQRMTIEEAFRDMKSSQYGFDLHSNKTVMKKANDKEYCGDKRLKLWLLLTALANLVAFIVGYYAEKEGLQRKFQANTLKTRVLSFVYLGCQIIRKKMSFTIPWGELDDFEVIS